MHSGQKSVFGLFNEVIERRNSVKKDKIKGTANSYEVKDYGKAPIFVVEGEIDAMSGYQATGYDFLALGDCALTQSMYEELLAGVKLPPSLFIVLLDNDDAGRKNTPNVVKKLIELNHKAIPAAWRVEGADSSPFKRKDGSEYKDLNDFLVDNPKGLQRWLDVLYDLPTLFLKLFYQQLNKVILCRLFIYFSTICYARYLCFR